MGTYRQNLYFIGIIPPEPVYTEVREFQQHMADAYHSKEALKTPPHITLIPPFQISEVREPELISFLERFASQQQPFELSVDGFGSFTTGVIYAALKAEDNLQKLEKDLSLSFYKKFIVARGPSHAYIPHITIAFKDLMPPIFPKAWDEFKSKLYRRKWKLQEITLLKHSGKEWAIDRKFSIDDVQDFDLFSTF